MAQHSSCKYPKLLISKTDRLKAVEYGFQQIQGRTKSIVASLGTDRLPVSLDRGGKVESTFYIANMYTISHQIHIIILKSALFAQFSIILLATGSV